MARLRFIIGLNGTGYSTKLDDGQQTSLVNIVDALVERVKGEQGHSCITGIAAEDSNHNLRDMGGLFAHSLETQVETALAPVHNLVKAGHKVDVIFHAFSRGVIAAFQAAIELSQYTSDQVTVRIGGGVDPATGNMAAFATASSMLSRNASWAAKVNDLSKCHNLVGVLLLFASRKPQYDVGHQSTSSLANECFDPLLPILPAHLTSDDIVIDVLPGVHGDLNNLTYRAASDDKTVAGVEVSGRPSIFAFHQVVDYLQKHGGVVMNMAALALPPTLDVNNTNLLKMLMGAAKGEIVAACTRDMLYGNKIISDESAPFLNYYHRQLVDPKSQEPVVLRVMNPRPDTTFMQQHQVGTVVNAVGGFFGRIASGFSNAVATVQTAPPVEPPLQLVAYLGDRKQTTTIPETGDVFLANALKSVTISGGMQKALQLNHSIDEQIEGVVRPIKKAIAAGKTVELVLFASEKSSMAAFAICQQLSSCKLEKLKIHLMLVDPRPGNSLGAATLSGIFSQERTWASKVAVLKECKHLAMVKFIFATDNLPPNPSLLSDAPEPILPALPKNRRIKTDVTVIPGNVADILRLENTEDGLTANNSAILLFHAAIKFLQQVGVKLDLTKLRFTSDLDVENGAALLGALNEELEKITGNGSRAMHLGNGISITAEADYLNEEHCCLLNSDPETETLALRVNDPAPTEESVKTFWSQQVTENTYFQVFTGVLGDHAVKVNERLGTAVPEDEREREEYLLKTVQGAGGVVSGTISTVRTSANAALTAVKVTLAATNATKKAGEQVNRALDSTSSMLPPPNAVTPTVAAWWQQGTELFQRVVTVPENGSSANHSGDPTQSHLDVEGGPLDDSSPGQKMS